MRATFLNREGLQDRSKDWAPGSLRSPGHQVLVSGPCSYWSAGLAILGHPLGIDQSQLECRCFIWGAKAIAVVAFPGLEKLPSACWLWSGSLFAEAGKLGLWC